MPVMLMCVIVFILLLRYRLHSIEKIERTEEENYQSIEAKASLPIKRSMADLTFLTIPDTLPFHDHPSKALKKCQDTLKNLSEKKICNLTEMSNTDLKLKYGAGNLEELSSYEQNYTLLIRTLADWCENLFLEGYDADAITVANYAMECKSDIRKTYATLAKIYKKQGDLDSLYALIPKVENLSHTLDLKKVIYDILNE